jgi:hypothetical protein
MVFQIFESWFIACNIVLQVIVSVLLRVTHGGQTATGKTIADRV